ncbi:ABC transporter permease, partial [Streptomyces sp. NPDC055144]
MATAAMAAASRAGIRGGPWLTFARRRMRRFLVALWVLMTTAFLMIHLVPGDPVRAALGMTAPTELVEARRQALG